MALQLDELPAGPGYGCVLTPASGLGDVRPLTIHLALCSDYDD
jgi:hypothetical protein